jgi:hypothetical protein
VTKPWRDSETDAGEGGGVDRELVCSVCAARITNEQHRTERAGAHEHTFANPYGIVHRVRCFAAASGLSELGVPETAFTWFPGYSWQIAHCASCQVHIGWIFRCAGDLFYGLVADRLVER